MSTIHALRAGRLAVDSRSVTPRTPPGAATPASPAQTKPDFIPLGSDTAREATGASEAAYLRFETQEEEIRKFAGRLRRLGAEHWPRHAEVVELFCGRGNGLHALQSLGFERVEGMDLSAALLAQYQGTATTHRGDCRRIPFPQRSKDVVIVQGGLHHLSALPYDLRQVFAEIHRVLRKDGRVAIVEPWPTPFLKLVHWLSARPAARRCSGKLDAFQTMFEHERITYERWLGHPGLILELARVYFAPMQESFAWGKWNFVGRPL